jgi:hypothetical protein
LKHWLTTLPPGRIHHDRNARSETRAAGDAAAKVAAGTAAAAASPASGFFLVERPDQFGRLDMRSVWVVEHD